MTPSSTQTPASHGRRRWSADLGPATTWILLAALLCCTVPIQSSPAQDRGTPDVLASQVSALAPFLTLVPTGDGKLWVRAQGTDQLAGVVYANTDIGPSHHKGQWKMTYSDALSGYVSVEAVSGLRAAQDDYGSLSISTTHGLDSGAVPFQRYYVPPATPRNLAWPGGAFELDIPTRSTFSTATYIAAAPSWGLPRPAPLGHGLASEVYSLRASSAQQDAARPMHLRLYIPRGLLGNADPHTLTIIGWDASENYWTNLGGALFSDQGYVSVATGPLTSYALMTTPAWRDTFHDHTGLLGWSNVVWGGSSDDPTLVLADTAHPGHATSVAITASSAAAPAARWDRLSYVATSDPPRHSLTIDLLRPDGTLVRSNLPNGADLSDLDTEQYPTLLMRANFESTVAGESPALHTWQLNWHPQPHTCYLPLIPTNP